jgi:hypothetical protein
MAGHGRMSSGRSLVLLRSPAGAADHAAVEEARGRGDLQESLALQQRDGCRRRDVRGINEVAPEGFPLELHERRNVRREPCALAEASPLQHWYVTSIDPVADRGREEPALGNFMRRSSLTAMLAEHGRRCCCDRRVAEGNGGLPIDGAAGNAGAFAKDELGAFVTNQSAELRLKAESVWQRQRWRRHLQQLEPRDPESDRGALKCVVSPGQTGRPKGAERWDCGRACREDHERNAPAVRSEAIQSRSGEEDLVARSGANAEHSSDRRLQIRA